MNAFACAADSAVCLRLGDERIAAALAIGEHGLHIENPFQKMVASRDRLRTSLLALSRPCGGRALARGESPISIFSLDYLIAASHTFP